MIKTLAKQIKEFKAASIATPLFMILEVFFPHSCFHDLRSAHGNDHPTDDGIDHR